MAAHFHFFKFLANNMKIKQVIIKFPLTIYKALIKIFSKSKCNPPKTSYGILNDYVFALYPIENL